MEGWLASVGRVWSSRVVKNITIEGLVKNSFFFLELAASSVKSKAQSKMILLLVELLTWVVVVAVVF